METMKINGMKCGHCSAAVTKALEELAGISNVHIDLEQGQASFDSDNSTDLNAIKTAISKIGFEAA